MNLHTKSSMGACEYKSLITEDTACTLITEYLFCFIIGIPFSTAYFENTCCSDVFGGIVNVLISQHWRPLIDVSETSQQRGPQDRPALSPFWNCSESSLCLVTAVYGLPTSVQNNRGGGGGGEEEEYEDEGKNDKGEK